ncbi:MFS transporter [Kytococcus sedentarius]|uniref:MFS transporter n=1 Tax=Kytococcus sedentarius TaxID=1276 RepID=UPI0035BC7C17
MTAHPSAPAPRPGLPRFLAPFATPDYRLLAASLLLVSFATGVWTVGLVYAVKGLGGTELDLSAVTAVGAVGLIVFALLGGVAADRLPLRGLLTACSTVLALVGAVVALLGATGQLQVWHLMVAAFVAMSAAGIYNPAYSALLPRVLHDDQLLAANGVEAASRPVLQQALGPAAAGFLVGALAPQAAMVVMAVSQALAVLCVLRMHTGGLTRRALPVEEGREPQTLWQDFTEGAAYTWRTPWLAATLVWSVVAVFLFIGPMEVLLPFIVTERGGGPDTFGLLLACLGVGAAVGAIGISSRPLPGRYLTVMISVWSVAAVPFFLLAVTDQFWLMGLVLFVFGVGDGVGMVIWGTLLQRRVPRSMLGRVSSLDFFVSLAMMPVSMAVAGPVAQVLPLWVIFALPSVGIPLLGLVCYVLADLRGDELRHPLDTQVDLAGAHTEVVDGISGLHASARTE